MCMVNENSVFHSSNSSVCLNANKSKFAFSVARATATQTLVEKLNKTRHNAMYAVWSKLATLYILLNSIVFFIFFLILLFHNTFRFVVSIYVLLTFFVD